jgi:hypothetical protein
VPGLWKKRKVYYSKPLLEATAFARQRSMQPEASENSTRKNELTPFSHHFLTTKSIPPILLCGGIFIRLTIPNGKLKGERGGSTLTHGVSLATYPR